MGKLFQANLKKHLIRFFMERGIFAALIIISVLAARIMKRHSRYTRL